MVHLGLDELEAHHYFLLKVVSMKLECFLHAIDGHKVCVNSFLSRLECFLDPRVKLFAAFITSLFKREYCVAFVTVCDYAINAEHTAAIITESLDYSRVGGMCRAKPLL